jgi:hypothetical protein
MEAKGEKRWLVRFDNGLKKDCLSVSLKMLGDPRYNKDSVISATIASVPNTSTCDALAPVASAPVASAHDTLASVAPAPVASDPVALAAVASAHDALASVASAPVASDTVASANNEDTSTHDTLGSMQWEDVDLVEADNEMEVDNEEDAGFDVVENVALDVYQWQQQECEPKKLHIIDSNWRVKTKSGNAELVWTVTPDSIPKNPLQEFSSLGV